MAVLRVRIFEDKLNDLLRGSNGPVVLHQANLGRQAAGIARRIAPRGKGPGPHLADNITSRLEPTSRGTTVLLVAGVPHAIYVHRGTRPHVIRGNPLLSFYWEKAGKHMVLPYVHHPGTKPNKFLLEAVRQVGLDARETR